MDDFRSLENPVLLLTAFFQASSLIQLFLLSRLSVLPLVKIIETLVKLVVSGSAYLTHLTTF